ncbi:hypothetical protein WQE_28754 [Paraburkholderia hospita]|uniref:Uncharacterized protein n=1 Tax=Paraburkholderia hospita TaxID=169430 RepID=A0ABN0FG26_9BURK|nr:hypothetical protein WQE_28754 [Paraburkholderia hospita]
MPQGPSFVAAYLAEPGDIEVCVRMGRVKLDASFVCFHGSILAFQYLQNDGAIEVQQWVVGKMLWRKLEHRQRLFAPRVSFAKLHTEIG